MCDVEEIEEMLHIESKTSFGHKIRIDVFFHANMGPVSVMCRYKLVIL